MSDNRSRAPVACQNCRCTQDRIECTVPPRKPHPPRQKRSSSTRRPSRSLDSAVSDRHNDERDGMTSAQPTEDRLSAQAEERNGMEIATAALEQPQRAGQVPFYAGELTGITPVFEVCIPQHSLPTHLLIPLQSSFNISPEDKDYLRKKGVYTLPTNDSCERLLHAYLHHVHPVMPVVDISLLMAFHQEGRLHQYNILLLWSIFFAGVNFIPAHVWGQEGYKSRKEMKRAMYYRAKCMYNIGIEADKVVQLQASLLLGFWHTDLDEMSQPWYWTGIAINLCQMLGLHRNPDARRYNSSISDSQRQLWRRLFWSCLFRDRWLSLTLGRPLRICLNDCDIPMPSASDVLDDTKKISQAVSTTYLPGDFAQLAQYWVKLIHLSKLLGAALTLNYQLLGPTPTLQQVEGLGREIEQYKVPEQYEPGLSRLAIFSMYHVQLHFQALLITFYRPYITKVPIGLHDVHQTEWQRMIRLKVESAASKTNSILDIMAQDRLLEFACPMTTPLLMPAMHIHLMNCKSTDPLSRRLGLNKLNMCMMVLQELQETYSVASIYRGVFSKAIKQLCPEYASGMPEDDIRPPTAESASVDARNDETQINDAMISDDLLDALMDEASIFSLWESWSRM
ncbi:C6 transcription factor, putative [Paecilomyces variotii No. 5]|uniref:C6 transcription factor, putative n=1 Tax=Byssochlamys spectabilis (strain No. 5 / NBRC 109023) TaxID=1356009 RepID=V5G119_BYSSN|nr:C6 transcription factor, putative [Paecilomyces variotii No. 5]